MSGSDQLKDLCRQVLADYQEPYPGAKARVALVLRVTVTAYIASSFKQQAQLLLEQLEN